MTDETKRAELSDEELEQTAGGRLDTIGDLANHIAGSMPVKAYCPYCGNDHVVTPDDSYIPKALVMYGECVHGYCCATAGRKFYVENVPNAIRHVYDDHGQLRATVL